MGHDIQKVYLPLATLTNCQFCSKEASDSLNLKLCSACGEVSSFHGSTFLRNLNIRFLSSDLTVLQRVKKRTGRSNISCTVVCARLGITPPENGY